jgi:hypothetical protein
LSFALRRPLSASKFNASQGPEKNRRRRSSLVNGNQFLRLDGDHRAFRRHSCRVGFRNRPVVAHRLQQEELFLWKVMLTESPAFRELAG